jgi:hypothetical protein
MTKLSSPGRSVLKMHDVFAIKSDDVTGRDGASSDVILTEDFKSFFTCSPLAKHVYECKQVDCDEVDVSEKDCYSNFMKGPILLFLILTSFF